MSSMISRIAATLEGSLARRAEPGLRVRQNGLEHDGEEHDRCPDHDPKDLQRQHHVGVRRRDERAELALRTHDREGCDA
jgi:hypothetical protein